MYMIAEHNDLYPIITALKTWHQGGAGSDMHCMHGTRITADRVSSRIKNIGGKICRKMFGYAHYMLSLTHHCLS